MSVGKEIEKKNKKKSSELMPLKNDINRNSNLLQQIKASAGSGKTHTLISKLLEIFCQTNPSTINSALTENPLQDNVQKASLSQDFSSIHSPSHSEIQRKLLSSVLAITFTNAAASDMKSKLIRRLKSIALGLEKEQYSPQQAKETIKACIANYSALNIRTIDSFLLMLLRQNIFEYHLPPQFDILFSEEEFFSPLYDELAFSALYQKNNPEDEVGKALLEYYKDIYSNFLELTDHKGFLGLQKVRSSVLSICSALSKIPENKRQNLTAKNDIFAVNTKSQKEYAKALKALELFVEEQKIKIKKSLKDAFEEFEERNKISSLFSHEVQKVKEEGIYVTALKALDEVEKAQVSRKLDTLIENVCKKHKLAYLIKSSLKYQPFIMLSNLTLEIQAHEEEAKEKLLSSRIVKLLEESIQEKHLLPAMLERMPYELDFFLVDEFQDTNNEQWQVIKEFVEEVRANNGSFTYVGDVKQAIYSWRGGDSSLFERVYEQSQEPKIKDFLDTNWRSSRYIIEFNNMLFKQFENLAFTQELERTLIKDDCFQKTSFAEDLVSIYENVAQKVSVKQANKDEGRVCLYPFEASGNSNEILHAKLKFHFLNALRDASKSYDYKDMAVLVRGNKDSELFATWLTEEKIPVITEGALLLEANFIVKQCISLLEFLIDEKNSVALWHLLGFKGLFSFENEEILCLEDYLLAKKKKEDLYTCLKNKNTKSSIECLEILEEIKEKKQKIDLYSLLSLLFEKTNIYTRFPEESGFFARFLELIFQADKNKISSIISFLAYWEEEGHLEKIPMPEGINAVRILTIHKSKGAEFDVVYVWDNLKKRTKMDALKLYEIEKLSFFAPHSVYHPHYANDNKIEAIEAMNLLYVALTRAKKELHVFYKESTKSTTLPLPFIFSDILDECTKNEELSCYEYGVRQVDKNDENTDSYDKEEKFSQLNYREAALNYSELKQIDEKEELALEKGLKFHAFFEKYFKYAKYKEDSQTYIVDLFKKYSLDKEQENEISAAIIETLEWIKSLEYFEDWKNNSLSEQNMLTKEGKLLRADLCVFSKDYTAIVDFKTGSENVVYKEQVREYMHAIQTFSNIKQVKVKGFIVYLDLKKIVEIEG